MHTDPLFQLINQLHTTFRSKNTQAPSQKTHFMKWLESLSQSIHPNTQTNIAEHMPIKKQNDHLSRNDTHAQIIPSKSTTTNMAISQAAKKYCIPEKMIKAVITTESSGDHMACSPVGAQGLMQLMPATAKELGVKNPFNPVDNINGGAKYLKQLHDRYHGNWEKALAAYNAGMGNVDKYQGIPPFKETIHYVKKVLGLYNS